MYYIGIDLGGTNISAGLVDENGIIICKESTPTINGRPYEDIIADMVELCEKVMRDGCIDTANIESVGIGLPGSIDRDKGILKYANNINITNVNIVEELKSRLKLPVYIENDANCAALGEITCGAALGAKNIIYVTIGTGVGVGIILNGKFFEGAYGGGGEAGHMVIVANGEMCSCGRKGCWEAYASASAIIREGRIAAAKYPNCAIYSLADGNIKLINAKLVFDAADTGDAIANKIVDDFIEYIAVGIVNLINIFQPEAVIVGGGVSAQGERLTAPIRKICRERVYGREFKTKISIATLGNDAGIVGAALLGKQKI